MNNSYEESGSRQSVASRKFNPAQSESMKTYAGSFVEDENIATRESHIFAVMATPGGFAESSILDWILNQDPNLRAMARVPKSTRSPCFENYAIEDSGVVNPLG